MTENLHGATSGLTAYSVLFKQKPQLPNLSHTAVTIQRSKVKGPQIAHQTTPLCRISHKTQHSSLHVCFQCGGDKQDLVSSTSSWFPPPLRADGEVEVQYRKRRRTEAGFVDRCLPPAPPPLCPPVKGSSELLEAGVSVVDACGEEVSEEGWTENAGSCFPAVVILQPSLAPECVGNF